jgi:hypothetical protein
MHGMPQERFTAVMNKKGTHEKYYNQYGLSIDAGPAVNRASGIQPRPLNRLLRQGLSDLHQTG